MGRCEEGSRAGYRACLRYQKVNSWITCYSAILFCASVYQQLWFSSMGMFLLICLCIHMHYHWRKEIIDWLASIERSKKIDEDFEKALKGLHEPARIDREVRERYG